MFIVIEILSQDEKFFDTLYKNQNSDVKITRSKKFDGESNLIDILINLSYFTIPFVAKVIIEFIKSRKHIKVKHKGIEITGLSEKTTLKVLKNILSGSKNE